jgi:hypothetical protein
MGKSAKKSKMTSIDSILSKMEDWDRISHCVTELNQSRAIAESDTVSAINHILAAIEQCKHKLTEQSPEERSTEALVKLTEECDKVEVSSRKRDENVHSTLFQLKQAVTAALRTDHYDQEEELDDSGDDEGQAKTLGISPATPEESDLIDRALAWHFLHEGYLETATTFSKETGLNCLPEVDLIRVRSGLEAADAMKKRKDLSLAISWLEEYCSATSSTLLFDLHRLRFLQLAASQTEAIGYAQRNFARFATSRSQEIQTLLGGLLFQPSSSSAASSAQSTNLSVVGDERAWEQARRALLNEVRRTYGSMSTLISTGSKALPELRVYQHLVAPDSRITRKSWIDATELPVQVETHAHFHSEFWCPVSQEQTDDQNNPPMLLVCGHVVAKSSILRIAKGRQRFKCPTCPAEQPVDAATPIHF